MLRNSLHQMVDEFYDFLIQKKIVDDDFEFGYWDQFWLAAFISFWIFSHTKRYGTDVPHRSGINYVAQGFLKIARGKLNEENDTYKFIFEQLQAKFPLMWD
jgi:hypothetical protein